MSALRPKADISHCERDVPIADIRGIISDVRFVPKADMSQFKWRLAHLLCSAALQP